MQDNGWGIPPANVADPERRDALEADMILDTLVEEVLPLYYDKSAPACPPEWVRRSKRAMATVIPRFNMRRVLFDYTRGLYQPAIGQYRRLAAEEFTGARTLAEWKQRVRAAWPKVSLKLLNDATRDLPRGERLRLSVAVALNGLAPPTCAWNSSAGGSCPGPTARRPRCAPSTSPPRTACGAARSAPRTGAKAGTRCSRSTWSRRSAASSPPRSASTPGTSSSPTLTSSA